MENNYILITPVKDEENTILKVIQSVKEQTQKPCVWIIVNDGSVDQTEKILIEETKGFGWIYILTKTINEKYSWLGYSNVIRAGIDYLNLLIKEQKIKCDFNFLGLLDSDITIDKNYFEYLVDYLNKNVEIGSISGDLFIKKGNNWINEATGDNPRGGARLYRYESLCKIGGFPKTPSPDTVSDIKLRIHKYKTTKVSDVKALQHRQTFSKDGKLKGMFLLGRSRYILCYNLFLIFFMSIKISFQRSPVFLSGIVYFFGYITGFLTKEIRIYDKEFIEYKNNFWQRIFKRND